MMIYYRVEIGGPKSRYRMTAWELVGQPEACCLRMKTAWGRLVDVGLAGFSRPENLVVAMATGHALSDGAPVSAIEVIRHCPWCGETIQLVKADDVLLEPSYEEGVL